MNSSSSHSFSSVRFPGLGSFPFFYRIAFCFYCHVPESVFKIAYLSWAKRIIRRRKHDDLCPIFYSGVCFLNAKQKTLSVFSNARLTNINHRIVFFVGTKEKINTTLLQNIHVLAFCLMLFEGIL
jgi:hypothetical protein